MRPMSTKEWAEQLVRKKREEVEAKKAEDQRELNEKQYIAEHAETAWQDLRQQLESHALALNAESAEPCIFVTFPNADRAQIHFATAGSPAVGFLNFDRRDRTLRVPFHGADLKLVIGSVGPLDWQSTATRDTWTNEQIAKRLIEYAWKDYIKR